MKKINTNIDKLVSLAEPGDIICVRTSGYFPRAIICWWTNSYYNHTANYIGNGMVIDSTVKNGVAERHISEIGTFEWSILRPKFYVDKIEILKNLRKYVGRKYDMIGILGFFMPWIKSDNNRFFCSEFTSQAYMESNYKLVARTACDKISPETVYQSMALDEIAKSNSDGKLTMVHMSVPCTNDHGYTLYTKNES